MSTNFVNIHNASISIGTTVLELIEKAYRHFHTHFTQEMLKEATESAFESYNTNSQMPSWLTSYADTIQSAEQATE